MTTQLDLFEVATLDTETRIVVQQEDKEFDRNMSDTGAAFIRACHNLRRIHGALRYKRPGFVAYCESKPGLSVGTAHRMLEVAGMFSESENIRIESREAIYLLAAPSTPESARLEAIERAEAGEAITYTTAREITNGHKPAPLPFDADEDEALDEYEQVIAYSHERAESARRQQIAVITGSSESNEWYTPRAVIDLARAVLGEIDLDPASCAQANAVIGALSYCTVAEDGYSQPWGHTDEPVRVWLNPPYGKEDDESETNAIRWSRKLITEYEAGRVSAALLLVKAALGYNWFEDLWAVYPTCLLRKRLAFVSPDGGERGQAKHATAILYLGPDVATFRRVFSAVGRVVLPEESE